MIQASMQIGHKPDKQDMVLDAREIMRTSYGTFMGHMEHELNLLDTTNRTGRAPKAVTGRCLNDSLNRRNFGTNHRRLVQSPRLHSSIDYCFPEEYEYIELNSER